MNRCKNAVVHCKICCSLLTKRSPRRPPCAVVTTNLKLVVELDGVLGRVLGAHVNTSPTLRICKIASCSDWAWSVRFQIRSNLLHRQNGKRISGFPLSDSSFPKLRNPGTNYFLDYLFNHRWTILLVFIARHFKFLPKNPVSQRTPESPLRGRIQKVQIQSKFFKFLSEQFWQISIRTSDLAFNVGNFYPNAGIWHPQN